VQTFKYIREEKKILLYTIPLILVVSIFTIKAIGLGYSDFASYYFGSKQLLLGDYINAYDTASLNLIISAQGFKDLFVSYTPFPPFTSVFFAPFTLLPIGMSKILFNIISCILFLVALYRSVNYFSIPPIYLLLVPLILYTPIRSNLFFGQSYLILFFLLLEGYMAYRKGQLVLSTALWSLAIVFKVFPILILFFLLTKKEYKNIIYLSGASLVLVGLSVLINGFPVWQFYVFKILPRLNNGELNDSFTFIFQSAFMLFKNCFIYDAVLNPKAIANSPYLFWISLAVFKAFIFSICVIASLRKKSDDFVNFSFWIMASILISPNGSTYSLVVLLIPLMALVRSEISVSYKLISAILLLLICNIPIHYFASLPLLLKFPRLYLLIAFFVAILIISKIKIDYKIVVAFVFIFLMMDSARLITRVDHSTYFFAEDKYALLYDYTIKDNKLTSYYWSVNGGQQEKIDYAAREYSAEELSLKDNQIYCKGKKITDSSDWKKKPMLIDKKYVLYLSDKNRGVGFYTLRKLRMN
jgi:hypothetical protein